MRAINHAMTGAIIGLAVTNPVALPLAFASHYVLDAIPHHAEKNHAINTKLFKAMLIIDALLCAFLVIIITIKHPTYWWIAALCAFLAASPDFIWFGDFIKVSKSGVRRDIKKRSAFARLHAWIQWFEKPIGIFVEIAWAFGAGVFLYYLLQR